MANESQAEICIFGSNSSKFITCRLKSALKTQLYGEMQFIHITCCVFLEHIKLQLPDLWNENLEKGT